MNNRPRAVLGAASCIHFLHDGFSETLYVFLPIWAKEFGLTLAQVGLIRSAYTGAMSAFQIPAGFLAERWGERRLLAAGTLMTACGFIAAGWAGGFVSLLVLLLAAGLGSGVQHPLSSSIVSKAYEAGRLRTALGTYNFSGDVGKAGVAAAIGLLARRHWLARGGRHLRRDRRRRRAGDRPAAEPSGRRSECAGRDLDGSGVERGLGHP